MNHNTRAFTAKNVDKNRSADNVEFCQEDIKQVYHKSVSYTHLDVYKRQKVEWIAKTDPRLYRAYKLKESLRLVFHNDTIEDAKEALDA